MIKDQLADMLARLQNASAKKHEIVFIYFTPLNDAIIKILFDEKLIQGYSTVFLGKHNKFIKISLKYYGWWIKKPYLISLKKSGTSKTPQFLKFPAVINAIKNNVIKSKLFLISTTSGILSLKKASSLKLGGKLLCEIN